MLHVIKNVRMKYNPKTRFTSENITAMQNWLLLRFLDIR